MYTHNIIFCIEFIRLRVCSYITYNIIIKCVCPRLSPLIISVYLYIEERVGGGSSATIPTLTPPPPVIETGKNKEAENQEENPCVRFSSKCVHPPPPTPRTLVCVYVYLRESESSVLSGFDGSRIIYKNNNMIYAYRIQFGLTLFTVSASILCSRQREIRPIVDKTIYIYIRFFILLRNISNRRTQ